MKDAIMKRLTTLLSIPKLQEATSGVPLPEITDEELENTEPLCHSILGNLLMFSWQRQELDDKPSIGLTLSRCAVTGLVAGYYEAKNRKMLGESLFNLLAANKGIIHWETNAWAAMCRSADDKTIKTFIELIDLAKGSLMLVMPKYVDSMMSEQTCLEASLAMYYLGMMLYAGAK